MVGSVASVVRVGFANESAKQWMKLVPVKIEENQQYNSDYGCMVSCICLTSSPAFSLLEPASYPLSLIQRQRFDTSIPF